MLESLIVRSYQQTDLDAVIGVYLEAIRSVASRDYDPAQIDAWAQVDRSKCEKRRLGRPI